MGNCVLVIEVIAYKRCGLLCTGNRGHTRGVGYYVLVTEVIAYKMCGLLCTGTRGHSIKKVWASVYW